MGIVGLGLAARLMGAAMREHPDTIIGSAADPDAEARARFEKLEGVKTYPSLDSMLDDAHIDAVYIASPHQFHAEQAVAAALRGKHVLVEKPMAISLHDCDAMIEAANRSGVALLVGHTHGFDPAIAAMRTLIESGDVGRPIAITQLNYTNFLYRPRRPDELDSISGGVIFNQLPHQIDIARSLACSPVRSVRAATNALDPQRPTEGGCIGFLDFENGAVATLVYSGYDRYDSDELHGWIGESGAKRTPQHGVARNRLSQLSGAHAEAEVRRSTLGYGIGDAPPYPAHQPHFGVLMVSCEHADLRQSADGVRVYDRNGDHELSLPAARWRPGQGDVLEEFCKAVRDGIPPLHDGSFGRGTVEVCLGILESARQRREVIFRKDSNQ